MKLNTKYHGIKEYEENDVITFNKGLPGFENLKKFVLVTVEENEAFSILNSIEEEDVGLVVISPFSFVKDYEIEIDDSLLEDLKIETHEDVQVLNTVTLNTNREKITTNLRAPIIINVKERLGQQIIINNDTYPIKYPLFKEWDHMLVISRKKGETILIGDNIEITVVKAEDGQVKLAISAPKNITILRKELYKEVIEENKNASHFDTSLIKNIKK